MARFRPLRAFTVFYRPLPSFTAQPRAHRDPHLHPKHVLPGVALQPQQARVQVPHEPAAVEIDPQSAMRPLGDAAVGALRIDTGEEEAELPVHPPPCRTHRRLVARGEEYGVLVAARRGTPTGDPEGGQVDLDRDGARLLGVAPESRPDERSAPVQRAGDWNQKARRRTDGTVKEFPFAHTAECNGRTRHGLEGLDLTSRDLEEAPREGGDDRASRSEERRVGK